MKKKTILTLAALGLTLLTVLLLPAQQDARATDINADADVLVNYDYETVTVNTTVDTVIYYTDTYYTDIAKWNVCEVRNGKAVFDISWINDNKTVRLYIRGDEQTRVVSKDITWQETLKVQYTGTLLSTDITEAEKWKNVYKAYPNFSNDTGYFIFLLDTAGRDTSYFDVQNIEWRKGDDGVWREFKDLDLKEMNIKGITLNFRVKAVNDAANRGGARASTVAVYKVAKLSRGPAVELNTDTMEITVENGMEFSLDKQNWTLIPDYDRRLGKEEYLVTQAQRDAAISEPLTTARINGLLIHKLLGIKSSEKLTKNYITTTYPNKFTYDDAATPTGIIVYVRDAGTVRRAASQIVEILVPFTENGMADADKDALDISLTTSKTGTGGITVVNNSDKKYQFAIIRADEYKAITDKKNIDVTEFSWISLKPGRTSRLTMAKAPEGCYVIYRIAGEEGALPSTYVVTDNPISYTGVAYAGVASEKKNVGDELVAVVSTNLSIDEVTCTWQRCSNYDTDTPVWRTITTGKTYKLTQDDVGCYMRVVISKGNSSKTSEPFGWIR